MYNRFELHKTEAIPAQLQTLHWHEKIQIRRYNVEEDKFSDWISKFEPSPLEKNFMEKYNKGKGVGKPEDDSTVSALRYAKQRLEEFQRASKECKEAEFAEEKERKREKVAASSLVHHHSEVELRPN